MELLMTLLAFVQENAPELQDAAETAKETATTANFNFGLKQAGAALGAGLTIVGGGFGIGRLAQAAMEGIARQPEAAGDIRGGMILAAALIEGVTLLALIICILAVLF